MSNLRMLLHAEDDYVITLFKLYTVQLALLITKTNPTFFQLMHVGFKFDISLDNERAFGF